jgi:hypothetical protein
LKNRTEFTEYNSYIFPLRVSCHVVSQVAT